MKFLIGCLVPVRVFIKWFPKFYVSNKLRTLLIRLDLVTYLHYFRKKGCLSQSEVDTLFDYVRWEETPTIKEDSPILSDNLDGLLLDTVCSDPDHSNFCLDEIDRNLKNLNSTEPSEKQKKKKWAKVLSKEEVALLLEAVSDEEPSDENELPDKKDLDKLKKQLKERLK